MKSETISALEKRYKVFIDPDEFYDPLIRQRKTMYRIYSADNCHWDTVVGYPSLVKTLAEDKASLSRIAQYR